MNLIEVHAKGDPSVMVQAADGLMRAAQAEGFVVRMGKPEAISAGDGWFAIDIGGADRAEAEARVNELIDEAGAAEMLGIEPNGPGGYSWQLQ